MRVISGKYRFKKIQRSLKGLKTDFRPTKSIVREAVFNIINHYNMNGMVDLDGAVVIDAFCGSGAYGIEAMSRGADVVYFVNNKPNDLELAKFNVNSLGDSDVKANFICQDATRLSGIDHPLDLIFIDPPYYSGLWRGCLQAIHDNLHLKANHIIILELARREKFETISGFNCLSDKEYGNTKIYVLQKNF